MVHDALAAAEDVAAEGIEAEVIDLRTVRPLDRDAILTSVERTGRLVIAHEAVEAFGIGGEIAALVADAGFWNLDAPILRVGAADTPAPYAPALEREWIPSAADVADAVRRVVRC
jgi:2-oxoisovalerate dehydrogenase E1 component